LKLRDCAEDALLTGLCAVREFNGAKQPAPYVFSDCSVLFAAHCGSQEHHNIGKPWQAKAVTDH
jgi:hypothetical protein